MFYTKISSIAEGSAIDFNKWMLLDKSKRAVVGGFGANGKLHLGHLANIMLYKILRKKAQHGTVFISDVGAFFSRKNVTWSDIEWYREEMIGLLQMANINSNDLFVESEHLHELFRDMKGVGHYTDLASILTIEEMKAYKFRNIAPLVVLSADELEYAALPGVYYFVYKDLLSPFKNTKMSKSAKGINIYIADALENRYKLNSNYFSYLKEYFSMVVKSASGPKSVIRRIGNATTLGEVVSICLNLS